MRLPAPRYLMLLAMLFPLFWLAASAASYFLAVTKCDGRHGAADAYIAYCQDRAYGDFEHAAFFFGLERVPAALAETKVLFLGNSKLQYAFSRDNVAPFFAERGMPFFVMGFGHGEQSRFPQLVLERHPAQPVLAVINVDPFFTDGITQPAAFPLQHPVAGRIDATFKSLMQRPRAWLCRRDPTLGLCAGEPALMRSRATGQWHVSAFRQGAEPTLPLPPPATVDDDEIDRWFTRALEIAPAFLETLHARCVVLTAVPSAAGDRAARRLANHLGVPFIAPEIDGLATIDGVHLDARSGIAWSDAFLRALDPVGRECGAW